MTHHPGPAPGPFLCKLFETLQSSFVRTFAHFTAFFARLFPPFGPFLCLHFFAVSAFWGWHFAAVSPPFFVLFFALFAGPWARSPRAAGAGSGGAGWHPFLCAISSRFVCPPAPAKPHKQRPERHQTRARVCVRVSSHFLCHYCAISVPPPLPTAAHRNTRRTIKNPGIKPFSAKYRGLQIGGR